MSRPLLIAALMMLSSPAVAQPADGEVGNSEFLILFPELRALGAPEVLREGLRVSYSALSGGGGTGATGVIQSDVVSIGPTVVVSQANYGDIGAGVIPLGQTVSRGLPALGIFWIHPSVLVNAESVANDSLTVSRYTKDVAGAMREVVRFQTNTSDGGRVVTEFSSSSGLLVFSSIGTTQSGSQATLLATRQLTVPWPVDSAPNWARPGAVLEYTGTKSTDIPGSGVSEQPALAVITVNLATPRWTTFRQSQTVGGVDGGVGETATGVTQLHGAIWLPPAALGATLPTAPTLVDTDAVTGAQTFVRSDATSITVQQELSGAIVTWTYDRTFGVLEQQRVALQGPVADEELVLNRSGGSDLSSLSSEPPLPPETSGSNNGNQGNNANAGNNDDNANPGNNDNEAENNEPGQDDPIVVVDDDEGGCATVGASGSWLTLFFVAAFVLRRRQRASVGH